MEGGHNDSNRPEQFSKEQLEKEESRIVSDAELIEKGSKLKMTKDGRKILDVSKNAIKDVYREGEIERMDTYQKLKDITAKKKLSESESSDMGSDNWFKICDEVGKMVDDVTTYKQAKALLDDLYENLYPIQSNFGMWRDAAKKQIRRLEEKMKTLQ